MFGSKWSLFTYPWTLPIQAANRAVSCHHSHPLQIFLACPHISPQPPPHFYRSVPNHPPHTLQMLGPSRPHQLDLTTSAISTLMLHMPKPFQSTMPHHLSHAVNTQKTVQKPCYVSFLFPDIPSHPSHTLCSLQVMQIPSLPTFVLLHEDTLPHLVPGRVASGQEASVFSGPVVWNFLPDDHYKSRTDTGTFQDWIENSPVSWGICLAALTAPMWLG